MRFGTKIARMMQSARKIREDAFKITQSMALSLALHGLLAMIFLLWYQQERKNLERRHAYKSQTVQVSWSKHSTDNKPKEMLSQQKNKREKQNKTEKKFAKTNADAKQSRPDRADYEGAHNSRAASDPTARAHRSEEESPAARGDERQQDEEIVTFDQERQEGTLNAEGKRQSAPAQPSQPAPESEEAQSTGTSLTADSIPAAKEAGTQNTTTPARQGEDNDFPADTANAPQGESNAAGDAPTCTPLQRAVHRYYDPALSEAAQQPGFRTHERKTRSSGRFIFGKGAALNVEATPRGLYEAEVYRRVAHQWYIACDDHRGDIIPGLITLSLRIDRQGRLVNMSLINRSGASVSQQSFTFAAIRRAALPSMPDTVKQDIVGELLELIFTFHFD